MECVAAGGRGRHTGLFLSERSLWRPKTCLCQIYMIFDRHRVGVINLNSDRNVTVIRTIVTVCLLRLHQTLYRNQEGLPFICHEMELLSVPRYQCVDVEKI